MRNVGAAVVGLVVLLVTAVSWGQEAPAGKRILSGTTLWRYHYTLMPPVMRTETGIEKIKITLRKLFYGGSGLDAGRWLDFPSALPPSGWQAPDFNDVDWHRNFLIDPDSPWVGHLALRGKFNVDDPTAVKELKLSVKYRGGVVVYINGKEIARGGIKPSTAPRELKLADEYPAEDGRGVRELKDIEIKSNMLRKGANVLAFEVYRSPMPAALVDLKSLRMPGGVCGVAEVDLRAAATDAVTPNWCRPSGLQVWNSSVMGEDQDSDYGDPNEPLRPIRIVAPRGGVGSGEVVVGSRAAIKGLKATMSALTGANGRGRISAASTQVRYGLMTGRSPHDRSGPRAYHLRRCDALAEVAPQEVPRRLPSISLVTVTRRRLTGAIVPVWVTVTVPANTKAGQYLGKLTITVPDEKTTVVPVELTVAPWKVPDPTRYSIFTEVVQSPESVAMAYNVPMWSKAHFKLLEKSLTLLRQVGSRTCYIPLICDTNMGNDESMVRWIKQADGTYKHDFTVMERYLDAVVKYQGKPTVVCIYVWDTYLEGGLQGAVSDIMNKPGPEATWLAGRQEHAGKGPIVSVLDPATGKVKKEILPQYSEAKSRKLWAPVMKGIRERLQKRGLAKTEMLGCITDTRPTKEVVKRFGELAPGIPWVAHAHERYQDRIHDAELGYTSVVAAWGRSQFNIDPSVERVYGWKTESLKTHNPRAIRNYFAATTWRFLGEMNATGRQLGFSRIGGDFFPVLKNAKGRVVGSLSARFPKSTWRQLGIRTATLARGQDEPVATARFEMMREGLQECEARVFIEKALTDEKKRAKLGEEFATKVQELLDNRARNMFRAVSALRQERKPWVTSCLSPTSWWSFPPVLGSHWFAGSGWQDETMKLYEAAADVEQKIRK